MATRVCAITAGYYEDVYRKPGEVFDVDIDFSKNKVDGLPKCPSWMLPVPESMSLSKEFKRDAAIQSAIKRMMEEDTSRTNKDLWISNGAPDVNELKRRTGIQDITSDERNLIWDKIKLPPSGKTNIA